MTDKITGVVVDIPTIIQICRAAKNERAIVIICHADDMDEAIDIPYQIGKRAVFVEVEDRGERVFERKA